MSDLSHLVEQLPDDPRLRQIALLRALQMRRKFVRLSQYDPTGATSGRRHDKQVQFHAAGATCRTRAFFGGNRTGKTVCGAAEDAYHLTGEYPEWWQGRRFSHPVRWWIASDTAESTRDAIQRVLMGPADELGTGLIPRHRIISYNWKRGVADALDTVRIRHATGGVSELGFKSYDQGRKKFQGTSRHGIHCDEEPPIEVYRECQQRLTDTCGLMMLTMTPLLGMSDVALLFFGDDYEEKERQKIRWKIQASWEDNPWLTPEVIAELEADMSAQELEARRDGRPVLGAGRIYPFSREQITVPTFRVPLTWPRGAGLDFGWRNTAATYLAYDEEGDIIYVYAEYKMGQLPPVNHVAGLKAVLERPYFGDPAGQGTSDQIDGRKVIEEYRRAGLDVVLADNAVAAGLLDCYQRCATGRLKIMQHCVQTLAEFDLYRRNERGFVVKENDHLMDAMRYGVRAVGRFEVPNRAVVMPHMNRRRYEPADAEAGY